MTRAHMQKGEDLEDSGSNVGRRRPRTGPKWAQAGRPKPAGPAHFEAKSPPFDLDASRATYSPLLTDKTRIHLRSASVRTYTFFTTGFPRFLSIRGATGLLALNQVLI
jgi:hypothetical protein